MAEPTATPPAVAAICWNIDGCCGAGMPTALGGALMGAGTGAEAAGAGARVWTGAGAGAGARACTGAVRRVEGGGLAERPRRTILFVLFVFLLIRFHARILFSTVVAVLEIVKCC